MVQKTEKLNFGIFVFSEFRILQKSRISGTYHWFTPAPHSRHFDNVKTMIRCCFPSDPSRLSKGTSQQTGVKNINLWSSLQIICYEIWWLIEEGMSRSKPLWRSFEGFKLTHFFPGKQTKHYLNRNSTICLEVHQDFRLQTVASKYIAFYYWTVLPKLLKQ